MYSICHSVFPLVGGVYVWGREGIGGVGVRLRKELMNALVC